MEQLTSVKSLTMLSLLHNPVVTRRNYREYVIHKFPNLRVLDFKKVKDKEREAAKKPYRLRKLFSGCIAPWLYCLKNLAI